MSMSHRQSSNKCSSQLDVGGGEPLDGCLSCHSTMRFGCNNVLQEPRDEGCWAKAGEEEEEAAEAEEGLAR